MSNIKVNNILWNALSEQEQLNITSHLKRFGVLATDQTITADANTPPPDLEQFQSADTQNAKLIDWICLSICYSTCDVSRCINNPHNVNHCLNVIRHDRFSHEFIQYPETLIQ